LKLPKFDTLPKKLAGAIPIIALLLSLYVAWPTLFPPPHFTQDQISSAESYMESQGFDFAPGGHLQFVGASSDGSGLYRAYGMWHGTPHTWEVMVYKDQSSADNGFPNEVQYLQTQGYKGDYATPSSWNGEKTNGVSCWVQEENYEGTYVIDVTHAAG